MSNVKRWKVKSSLEELIISAKKQQLGFRNGTPGNVQFACQIVGVPKKLKFMVFYHLAQF